MTLSAELDGDLVDETSLVPSSRRVWRLSVEGEGWSFLEIYLDGMLLYEYDVDFDDNSIEMVEDYSDDFEDW